MQALKRIGIDAYMLTLFAVVGMGVVLPASGIVTTVLGDVTFWAVALLFFLYGAKLDMAAVRAGIMNLRLQALSFAATWLLFPVMGLLIAWSMGDLLGPELTIGILFLAVLPSTIQSSIAFTAMAGGNVAGAICSATLSNMVAVVLTPVLMAALLHQSGGISTDAIAKIAVQILLPFIIGQMLRRWIGAFIQRHRALTMIVDRGSILLIVYAAFSAGTIAGIWSAIPAPRLMLLGAVIAAYLAFIMGAVALTARKSGMAQADRATLLFCGSTKSLASGLPIATALFSPATLGAIILPTMLFHLLQLLVCAMIAQRMSVIAQDVSPRQAA